MIVANKDIHIGTTGVTLDNLQKYSTSETIIGTWINDKPIYRKVFNITTPNAQTGQVGTIANLDEVVNVYGFLNGGVERMSSNYFYTTSNAIATFIDRNGAVQMQVLYSNYRNRKAYIIVEYTKTTD